jgi:hypothetical protein
VIEIMKEEDKNKKLKACLRATEDKVLSFIMDINSMLDNNEDFLASNEPFTQLFNDFITNKHIVN